MDGQDKHLQDIIIPQGYHRSAYLDSRCILHLNGHLFSINLDFSGVQAACNHKYSKCQELTRSHGESTDVHELRKGIKFALTCIPFVVSDKTFGEEANNESWKEQAVY